MSRSIGRPIAGRTVAITGAARGIGRATATALTRRGARVAIGDLDADRAAHVAAEIGGDTIALPLNVSERDSVEAFVDEAERLLGPLDVMVNNAGIMPTVRFLDESLESIQRQLSINVLGVIHGMQVVIPRMLARNGGHVVNVASSAGKFAQAGLATYCGTKHAVVGITDSVRHELKDTPVRLSMVMPGIVRTELTSGLGETRGIKPQQPEEIGDAIVEALETGRYEVWCPRSLSPVYRTTRLLPDRWVSAAVALLGGDKAVLQAIDSPERAEYNRRIELADERQRQLESAAKR